MPIAVLGIVVALITPMPPFMLDILIVLDITMSVIVLMVAMYILKPVDFSVFPTTLLLLTLFRLALNVSSARLILLNGNTGTSAAGQVIESFGNFVVGGNYIIGAVIFLVLIAIQYVVINHGAVRISEVAARFTLDALPGKQMSIDADLNAGLCNETEARAEAQTTGQRGGVLRGNGWRLAVHPARRSCVHSDHRHQHHRGVPDRRIPAQHGVAPRDETYTVLTIGDGLVTVIPALMISVSGGLIVTRASSDARVGVEFQKQLFGRTQPLFLSSGVLIALAAFPGLPTIPFLIMGGGLGTVAWLKRQKNDAVVKQQTLWRQSPPKRTSKRCSGWEPVSIEVGLGLAGLVAGGTKLAAAAKSRRDSQATGHQFWATVFLRCA